jgi:glycerol-3-phosphate acyltransferase PlsY
VPTWLALIGAYFIGSLDFAVVVARAHGVDIHSVGSGNPGASNVLRTLGRGPATMVLLGDALKGVISAAIGWLAAGAGVSPAAEPIAYAAGFVAVVGHTFPAFHRFRGGKGVATGAGVMFFTVPLAALALAGVWLVVAKLFKVASVASLTVVVLALPLAWWRGTEGVALWWWSAILVLVIIRHAPNIRRMISGSEEQVPT